MRIFRLFAVAYDESELFNLVMWLVVVFVLGMFVTAVVWR